VFLPTYGVFDEKRFVSPGRRLDVAGTEIGRIGLLVCEDAWHSACATALALKGAQMILIPSASPGRGFAGERPHSVDSWRALMRAIALEHGVWVALANLTGFEGSRGFPGGSLVVSPEGGIVAELGDGDDVLRCDVDLAEVSRVRTTYPLLSDLRGTLDVILRAIEEGRC
jgi:predicted amidohydrolase